jgi:ubiquinone/menaquinone biosynthesis C-methylase UbiE
MTDQAKYIPAFRFNFLTPLFDPMVRLTMRELTFKRRLIERSGISAGVRVLDLGSGTGTLSVLIKKMHPAAEVVGVDGDPNVLAIAREKAGRAGTNIRFDQGMAYQLPYPDQSFDRVLSSLVFHHLTTEDKRRALLECLRVLAPGGELLIADFGKPQNLWARIVSRVMARLERTEELTKGRLAEMMRQAGFEGVQIADRFMTFFGTIAIYHGRRQPTRGNA